MFVKKFERPKQRSFQFYDGSDLLKTIGKETMKLPKTVSAKKNLNTLKRLFWNDRQECIFST